MHKTLYFVLLGAIVLLSGAATDAQIIAAPGTQSSVTTGSSVDRVAYLEQKVANLECSLADCKDTTECCGSCRRCCCLPPWPSRCR